VTVPAGALFGRSSRYRMAKRDTAKLHQKAANQNKARGRI
jgi:hypothetical protein